MSEKNENDVESLKREIASLKKQLADVKKGKSAEASRENDDFGDFVKDYSKTIADANRQIGDELTRFIRSYSDATATYFAGISDVVSAVNDELSRRTKEDDESEDDAMQNMAKLPNHIGWAYLEGVKKSAEIPGKVLDAFNESYQNSGESEKAS